jgi:hypothetical protein
VLLLTRGPGHPCLAVAGDRGTEEVGGQPPQLAGERSGTLDEDRQILHEALTGVRVRDHGAHGDLAERTEGVVRSDDQPRLLDHGPGLADAQ